MNIDFPNNPNSGDQFTDHNSTVWVYDNARWRRKTPSVIPGTPNFYSPTTIAVDVATPAITAPAGGTLLDVFSDKLTALIDPEVPVDGMAYYIDRDLSQGANNLAAGVWRFTVDPALGLNEWVHVFNYQSGDGILKATDLNALPGILPVTTDGDLVEVVSNGRVYVRRINPDRFEDLNQSFHIVPTGAERNLLKEPRDVIQGSLCLVEANNTIYQRVGTEWWEFPSVPDHTVRDRTMRLEYDPTRLVGDQLIWVDDRESPAVVDDEAALLALPNQHLAPGKLVYVKSTGQLLQHLPDLATRTYTMADWQPLVGGVTYVGRYGNLPNPITENIVDGQMFIVNMDFAGHPLTRLVSWDASLPARQASSPSGLTTNVSIPQPIIGTDTEAEVDFSGMPGMANAVADVTLEVVTGTTPAHSFVYKTFPGDTLAHIVSALATGYNALANKDTEVAATTRGDTLVLTGSPGRNAQPGRTVTGARFVAAVTMDQDIDVFLSNPNAQLGDYVVNDSGFDLNAPDGTIVPADFAVIIESLNPTVYHVSDAATPVTPMVSVTQQGTGAFNFGASPVDFATWQQSGTLQDGDFWVNVGQNPINASGYIVAPGHAIIQSPAGLLATTAPYPAIPQRQPTVTTNELTGIVSQLMFDAAVMDPANQVPGKWLQNTSNTPFLLYQHLNNPNLPPGSNYVIPIGGWAMWDPSLAGGLGAWMAYAANVPTPGASVQGAIIPGAFDPPNPLPEADYQLPATAPATVPDATVPASPQIDATDFTAITVSVTNVGVPQTVPAGGWRILNREVWSKNLRADTDQATDQQQGDLQITTEKDHEEAKVWDAQGAQWVTWYSHDALSAEIASMNFFEDTVQEVGGAAVGAVDFSNLPDLAAMSAANDVAKSGHYWTFIGTPNYQITAGTPTIGADLQGGVLNPGDWLRVANSGGDGTGVGVNGGAPQLHWTIIGGDLLAKMRADRLFGLQPWQAAGWEQGSLVTYQGDIYRATGAVNAADNPPVGPPAGMIQIPLSGTVSNDLSGGGLAMLSASPQDGDIEEATGSGSINAMGEPFYNLNYATGDKFLYSANSAFSGSGFTAEGYQYDGGWIRLGQMPTVANPFDVTAPPGPAGPWAKVNLNGGLRSVPDDSSLPNSAPAGEVWVVLQSAQAGGRIGLYSYDMGAQRWQELGGSGMPLDLTGGQVVYPKTIFVDADLSGPLSNKIAITGTPEIVGDLLVGTDGASHAVPKAIAVPHALHPTIAPNQAAWQHLQLQRITNNATGSGRPAQADYPSQINFGFSGGKAKITHVADQNLDWVEHDTPQIPSVAEAGSVQLNASSSVFKAIGTGVVFEGVGKALKDTAVYLGFMSSSMKGQTISVTGWQQLHIPSTGRYSQSFSGSATFDSSGYAWVKVNYSDSHNKINGGSPFDWRLATGLISSNLPSSRKDYVASLAMHYRRHHDNAACYYHGVFEFSAQSGISLVAFGTESAAAHISCFSNLKPRW